MTVLFPLGTEGVFVIFFTKEELNRGFTLNWTEKGARVTRKSLE